MYTYNREQCNNNFNEIIGKRKKNKEKEKKNKDCKQMLI